MPLLPILSLNSDDSRSPWCGENNYAAATYKLYLSPNDTLFVNVDEKHRLFGLASSFYKNGGKHLFIDEVHKYSEWVKELKMMYDYYPDFQVVFTGSSILDFYKGNADLSRRVFIPKGGFRN